VQFEIRFTYEFVSRSLPHGCGRILEIGCGSGELASALAHNFAVVAIDSSEESVIAARKLGVDARMASWPHFDDEKFDAILFTRSLHHIHPLEEAVRRASELLNDGGRLIVEDFAHESADEKSLRWFADAVKTLDAAGLLTKDDEFLRAVRAKTATLSAWQEDHGHHLHPAAKIQTEIQKVFGEVKREEAPYYFRYVARAIVPTRDRDAILRKLAVEETDLMAKGAIVPLGRRFVAGEVKLILSGEGQAGTCRS
jgi:SAM-dependent methyltransferase